jgi:CO/xanthine dehydrogenase FAD-binding subunit
LLVRDDSGVLTNLDGDPGAWDPVLRRLLEQASPISDVRGSRDYRQAMLLVMSRRALRAAIERMRNEGTTS